jgi:hypothetical protein
MDIQCGNQILGYHCVSPIIDLTNSTPNEVIVCFACLKESLFLSESSRLYICSQGGKSLLTNLLPSTPSLMSYIAVGFDGMDGDFDLYSLVFDLAKGYQILSASTRVRQGAGGETIRVDESRHTNLIVTKAVYPLDFCGCVVPQWPWRLVLTASIKLANREVLSSQRPQRPQQPALRDSLGEWAVNGVPII